MVRGIAPKMLSKVDVYYKILQDLRQNSIYMYRLSIVISAKGGTVAKVRLYPVPGNLGVKLCLCDTGLRGPLLTRLTTYIYMHTSEFDSLSYISPANPNPSTAKAICGRHTAI
jgi:hypothetical protein